MTIDASCPNCGTIFTLRRELIGKRTKCSRCGTPFTITEMPPSQARPATPPPPPEQALYADIPAHPSYAAHSIPPTAEQAPPHGSVAREFVGFEQGKQRPRFPVLNMVVRGYEILAIILLAIGVITLIVGIVQVIANPQAILPILVRSGMVFLWSLATALMCLFFSQAMRLALQIEQNTRETSEACRQLAEHFSAIQIVP